MKKNNIKRTLISSALLLPLFTSAAYSQTLLLEQDFEHGLGQTYANDLWFSDLDNAHVSGDASIEGAQSLYFPAYEKDGRSPNVSHPLEINQNFGEYKTFTISTQVRYQADLDTQQKARFCGWLKLSSGTSYNACSHFLPTLQNGQISDLSFKLDAPVGEEVVSFTPQFTAKLSANTEFWLDTFTASLSRSELVTSTQLGMQNNDFETGSLAEIRESWFEGMFEDSQLLTLETQSPISGSASARFVVEDQQFNIALSHPIEQLPVLSGQQLTLTIQNRGDQLIMVDLGASAVDYLDGDAHDDILANTGYQFVNLAPNEVRTLTVRQRLEGVSNLDYISTNALIWSDSGYIDVVIDDVKWHALSPKD